MWIPKSNEGCVYVAFRDIRLLSNKAKKKKKAEKNEKLHRATTCKLRRPTEYPRQKTRDYETTVKWNMACSVTGRIKC